VLLHYLAKRETRKFHFFTRRISVARIQPVPAWFLQSFWLTTHTLLYDSLNLVTNTFSLGLLWGMVQEKGSREHCSNWTVLHAQNTRALSSGFPLSQGNAEALDRWGGKEKHCLISYFMGNTSAKNYGNRIVYVKIIARQRWGVFWDTVYKQVCLIVPCSTHITHSFLMFPGISVVIKL